MKEFERPMSLQLKDLLTRTYILSSVVCDRQQYAPAG